MANQQSATPIDGIGLDNPNGQPPMPGILRGFLLKFLGNQNNRAISSQAAPGAAPTLTAGAYTGTATASSTTTMTAEAGAAFVFIANAFAGATITMGGKTMVIVSHTAGPSAVFTGASWSGGSTPTVGAYSIAMPATVLQSGIYSVSITYVTNNTAPVQETSISPGGTVSMAANGGQITMAAIQSIPAGVVAIRYYYLVCSGNSDVIAKKAGFIVEKAVASSQVGIFPITTYGDGSFGPLINQMVGSIQLPAVNGGGMLTGSGASNTTALTGPVSTVRTISVAGVATTDLLFGLIKPSDQANLMLEAQRISSAGNIEVKYTALTGAITPATETLLFYVYRPPVTTTFTVLNTLVTSATKVFPSIRAGSTTPNANSNIVPYITAITPGTGFQVVLINLGTVTTLATDYILDYILVS